MTKHKFTLYASDLMIGNNCVLVKADGSQFTYISYNSFNSMHTSNKFFNTQSERWMDNLISKSTLLSNVAEKQRNVFFKGIYKTISDLKLYIENNA
ncbi:MAG: hypothetical protein H7321_07505 [Bacteroidia bacterium]|nr:hypothetical protein [Bacteroidia bacterium]